MAFANVSDLITTTLEERSPDIADNVLENDAFLFTLNKKGNVRPFSGGRIIYEPLAFAENPNGGSYSGYDVLPVGPADVISAAEFSLKQYAVPVSTSGLEELQNMGKNQVIDLVEGRINVAKSTMRNLLEAGLFSDGSGNGGKDLVGLDALLDTTPSTGTYGGISRVNYSFWRNVVNTVTISASNASQELTETYADTTRMNDAPNLILAGGTFWKFYMAQQQNLQRFTDPDLSNVGFTNIMFMGAPLVLCGGVGGSATATDAYLLNTKYTHWRPHSSRNMVPLKKRDSFNQDASVVPLVWAGALTCSGLRFQGRIVGA